MNLLTKDSQTFLQRKDITNADGLIAFIFYLYILLLTCVYMYSLKHGVLDNLSENNTFYILAVGFFEEILFRGFIWPRLTSFFGSNIGTILTGILFGVTHAPMSVILHDTPIFLALFNNIGSGILGQLVFGYVYTKSRHIMVPSFIHGLLDAL